jgi:hypothetical protein
LSAKPNNPYLKPSVTSCMHVLMSFSGGFYLSAMTRHTPTHGSPLVVNMALRISLSKHRVLTPWCLLVSLAREMVYPCQLPDRTRHLQMTCRGRPSLAMSSLVAVQNAVLPFERSRSQSTASQPVRAFSHIHIHNMMVALIIQLCLVSCHGTRHASTHTTSPS